MDSHPLELILKYAATEGIAYFEDLAGNGYFRPYNGQPIRPLVHGHDDHPLMYQFSHQNPLAEVGRIFLSLGEADHYVKALTDFDRMMFLAVFSQNPQLPDNVRASLCAYALERQRSITQHHLPVLETVRDFGKLTKYLEMTPEQIYHDVTVSISS
ncbi:hypothetical protein HZB02_06180 [Candidatus Woesearchaeota archaeon]|nr:hypothetical protein [Candidatus Woesearchaeota archaeon]